MKDTINPIGLDLTKNLHGHVRIETRDRWTGKVVDSQEKDNLITNMPQKLVSMLAWQRMGDTSASEMLPYPFYSRSLGGLLLFDSTLTASANNIWLPANAKIVAMAGQDANSSDVNRGSYNASESTLTSNGFTSVWDFLTSQANGTIASLARTHFKFADSAGFYKYDSSHPYLSLLTGSFSFYPLGYNDSEGYIYVGGNGSSAYPYSNIYKAKFSFDEVGLSGGVDKNVTLVKTLTSSDGNTYAYQFTYDKWANNFIYLSDNTLHIVEMDGTHSTKTLSSGSGRLGVTENYYWKYSSGTAWRYQKTNVSNVTSYSSLAGNGIAPCENDIITIFSNSKWAMLYPDGTSFIVDASMPANGSSSFKQVGACYTYNASNNLWLPSHYLGTIANLDSPVTKTNSQTMKITYTLTEA